MPVSGCPHGFKVNYIAVDHIELYLIDSILMQNTGKLSGKGCPILGFKVSLRV